MPAIQTTNKLSDCVLEALNRHRSITWAKETTILDPEYTADRHRREKGEVEIRVAHNFSFLSGKTMPGPVHVKPSRKHKRPGLIMRANVASLNGPSRFLAQAGEFDIEWPLMDVIPMQVNNIKKICIDKDRRFQDNKSTICVRTTKYIYFLLAPEDFYLEWWSDSLKEWVKTTDDGGSLEFVGISPDADRPLWFRGTGSWAGYLQDKKEQGSVAGAVHMVPTRTDDEFDGESDTEEPAYDLAIAPGAPVPTILASENVPRETKVMTRTSLSNRQDGDRRQAQRSKRSSSAPIPVPALGNQMYTSPHTPSWSLKLPSKVVGAIHPHNEPILNHMPIPFNGAEFYSSDSKLTNVPTEAGSSASLQVMNTVEPASGLSASGDLFVTAQLSAEIPPLPLQKFHLQQSLPSFSHLLTSLSETQIDVSMMAPDMNIPDRSLSRQMHQQSSDALHLCNSGPPTAAPINLDDSAISYEHSGRVVAHGCGVSVSTEGHCILPSHDLQDWPRKLSPLSQHECDPETEQWISDVLNMLDAPLDCQLDPMAACEQVVSPTMT